MKIEKVRIKNFRSLEDFEVNLDKHYTSICGKNDAGKTAFFTCLRYLFEEQEFFFEDEVSLSIKDDYPKWKTSDPLDERSIEIEAFLSINKISDIGIYQLIRKQLDIEEEEEELRISVKNISVNGENKTEINHRENTYDGLDADQVIRNLKSANSVLYHNSTSLHSRHRLVQIGGMLTEFSPQFVEVGEEISNYSNKKLKSFLRGHQKEVSQLLGRLESKYKVSLSTPSPNFRYIPYSISLGDKSGDVLLDNWGSGTQNRTLILLTIFRAKQISLAKATAGKVTPVILIEEPECYLHPSAQAEFGRVLQDLAEEFGVQVVATSHSPYLLSKKSASSNVLLEREAKGKEMRGTKRVNIDDTDWMKPFALALGLSNSVLEPWKDLLFSNAESVVLVEGDIDKKYLEYFQTSIHGTKALKEAEIFAYGGHGKLNSSDVLLQFLKERYTNVIITYDLDVKKHVDKTINRLAVIDKKKCLPVGLNEAGARCMEGLLPSGVRSEVNATNQDLVNAAMSGVTEEASSAHDRLKNLYWEEFDKKWKEKTDCFERFYQLVRDINKRIK